MSRRYGRLLAATLAAVLTVGIAGCSSDDKDKGGAGGKIEKVVYMTGFGAVGREAWTWVAKEKGFYKEAGFDVDIQLGSGTDNTLAKMTGGQVQFGTADLSGVAINNGNNKLKGVKALAALQQQTLVSVMFPTEGVIKSPKDLEGKKVGMAKASVNQLLFPAYAKLAGIDVNKVTIQDLPNTGLAQALAANQVDAISTFLISQKGIESASKKKMTVMPYGDFLRDLYGNGLFVSDQYLAKDKEGAKRFRDASLRGLKYSLEHPEEAAEIMVKSGATGANKDAAIGEITLMTPYVTSGSGAFGELTEERANKAIAILQGAGLIQPGLKPSDMISLDLTPKA